MYLRDYLQDMLIHIITKVNNIGQNVTTWQYMATRQFTLLAKISIPVELYL